jgi:hypothetical protein
MSVQIQSLTKECDTIEKSIKESYIDENGLSDPIVDGIVNIEKYLNQEFKILWILKEPYDDVENGLPSGGGWHYCKDFVSANEFIKKIGRSRATWHPIIYVSYGILNNFALFENMGYIRNDESMADVVKDIAVINVKKLPGFTQTCDYGTIGSAYNRHKDILLRQIETYKPNIIIGGSTMQLFYNDLGISDIQKNYGSVNYAVKDMKLFITAYHPAQRTITRPSYVNDIVNCVKQWA